MSMRPISTSKQKVPPSMPKPKFATNTSLPKRWNTMSLLKTLTEKILLLLGKKTTIQPNETKIIKANNLVKNYAFLELGLRSFIHRENHFESGRKNH